MSARNTPILTTLIILLLAVFFRLWHFEDSPPGLQHDEFFKAQEGRAIVENGDIRLFYPSNQGHEGGYVWLNGLAYALFGANRVMVKLPPLWCGLLTLAMLYRVGKDVFNIRVAIVAMGLGAVSFWWVSTNRVGLRANLLPLVTLWVLWGLWRVGFAHPDYPQRHWGIAIFTGILLGSGIYTYTASIALYAAYGIFLLALLLVDRPTLKRRLPEWMLITLLGASLTLPMLNTRLNDPQGRNRVSTINYPYTELKAGNLDPVVTNARLLLTMPLLSGDPEWRYNVADRPLFIVPVGLLVYLGFGLTMWRIKKPLHAMLLALALLGLVPSLLTLAAPSFLRSIITLPSLMLFIGVAVDTLTRSQTKLVWGVGIGLITLTAALDGFAYFHTWTNSPEVQAIYRDDLEQLAGYLRRTDAALAFASTEEPYLLDPGIFEFSNAPQQTKVVWFNGVTNIVLNDQPTLLFVSPLSPISPAHAPWLAPEAGTGYLGQLKRQDGQVAFEIYSLAAQGDALNTQLAQAQTYPIFLAPPPPFPSDQVADWGTPYPLPVNFGDVLQLVGVEMPSTQIPPQDNGVDNGLNLQLYLKPLVNEYDQPLSLFVHFIAWDGSVFAGRDFLGVPPLHWQAGIVFIQDNYVGNFNLEARPYFVSMGLYNTLTKERYPILDENGNSLGDNIILGQLEIVTP